MINAEQWPCTKNIGSFDDQILVHSAQWPFIYKV